MDFVVRLKEYMVLAGITSTQFADKAGIPRPTLSQILNGRNKTINNEVISKIHNAFPEMNISWLLFGDGDPGVIVNIETSGPENLSSDSVGPREISDDESDTDLFTYSDTPIENNAKIYSSGDNRPDNSQKRISFSNSAIDSHETHQHGSDAKIINRETDIESGSGIQDTSGRSAEHIATPNWQSHNSIASESHNAASVNSRISEDAYNAAAVKQFSGIKMTNPISPNSKSRKVTSIMVFYSDNSYETFLPA